MMLVHEFNKVLNSFIPIGLGEMDNVRLMDRIDTKYVLSVNRIPDLLKRMDGGYKILEINKHRFFPYLTTYLDTNDYMFFNQHVIGKPERNKVRYRKYETSGTTYLEVKKRTNKNRTIKWRIENDLTSDRKCDDKAFDFIKNYVPQKAVMLKPVLINYFKRVTFVGSEFNERITIDYDISFSDTNGNRTNLPFIAIIELKRQGFNNRSPVVNILKEYSIHPTGFSKYCVGTAIFNDLPRKNILKAKLLMIKKIENEYYRCLNA
jgi:hypothetical protein